MTVRILVSASGERAGDECARPRRDFDALASALGAELRFRPGATAAPGWRSKLLGPHVRQAWAAAAEAQPGDTLFADGEHIGIPLALALGLRRKRDVRVVFIAHLLKPWKARALWLASRVHGRGAVAVHSVVQERIARRSARSSWQVELLPYQVDTRFWTPGPQPPRERPLVVAVGSESRDYPTLVDAARGGEFDVTIAAGSHWARTTQSANDLPENVTLRTDILPQSELREIYRAADVVVVPLAEVANQSGITAILEAMAMGRPVIVSATRGQREAVAGPLVVVDGGLTEFAKHRGPALFGIEEGGITPNGLYVAPGHPAALRAAIELVLRDRDLARTLAANARETVERGFTIEEFARRFASFACAGEGSR